MLAAPGVAQKWRWGFYSCNGFHTPTEEMQYGGIQVGASAAGSQASSVGASTKQ